MQNETENLILVIKNSDNPAVREAAEAKLLELHKNDNTHDLIKLYYKIAFSNSLKQNVEKLINSTWKNEAEISKLVNLPAKLERDLENYLVDKMISPLGNEYSHCNECAVEYLANAKKNNAPKLVKLIATLGIITEFQHRVSYEIRSHNLKLISDNKDLSFSKELISWLNAKVEEELDKYAEKGRYEILIELSQSDDAPIALKEAAKKRIDAAAMMALKEAVEGYGYPMILEFMKNKNVSESVRIAAEKELDETVHKTISSLVKQGDFNRVIYIANDKDLSLELRNEAKNNIKNAILEGIKSRNRNFDRDFYYNDIEFYKILIALSEIKELPDDAREIAKNSISTAVKHTIETIPRFDDGYRYARNELPRIYKNPLVPQDVQQFAARKWVDMSTEEDCIAISKDSFFDSGIRAYATAKAEEKAIKNKTDEIHEKTNKGDYLGLIKMSEDDKTPKKLIPVIKDNIEQAAAKALSEAENWKRHEEISNIATNEKLPEYIRSNAKIILAREVEKITKELHITPDEVKELKQKHDELVKSKKPKKSEKMPKLPRV